MTQVRKEYLRWITVYLWRCGIAACDHVEPEFKRLNYTGINALRISVLNKFKELPTERFLELRDIAGLWVCHQHTDTIEAWFKEFDVAAEQTDEFGSWLSPQKFAA